MTPSETRDPTAPTPRRAAPHWPPDEPRLTDLALTVNGQLRTVAAGTTVAELLRTLDLDPRLVVVEHNREIVHDRGTLAARTLHTGDVLELVHFVGGG